MKDKNHMITSIDVQKSFDKIQHPFRIKTPRKVEIEGTCLNIINTIYGKYYTQWEKVKSFFLTIRKKIMFSTFNTFIQHGFGRPSHRNQKIKKKIEGIQIGKEEVKLPLFADDMVLHIENPKDSTKELLELTNEFSKVAGYKINIQKFVAFLYTNNQKEKLLKQSYL